MLGGILSRMDNATSAREVARWSSTLQWSQVPSEVRNHVQRLLINNIAALLGGTGCVAWRAAAAFAASDGFGTGRVVGLPGRYPITAAAVANGVSSSALDYDDGHLLGGGIHAGPPILAALLTIADQVSEETGVNLMVAMLAGYEVATRTGYLLWPEGRSKQAHTAGTASTVGTAAAVARMLGFDSEQTHRALEIAWAHAPISVLQFPMVKESLGWSAAAGLGAACLARAGFKKQPTDAERFGASYSPPTPFDARAEPVVGGLGSVWWVLDVYLKPYSACRFAHSAADAALALHHRHGFEVGDIESIDLFVHRDGLFMDNPDPDTEDAAQYSYQFVVAGVLHDGCFGATYIDRVFDRDPSRADLAHRISVRHDPALDGDWVKGYPTRVVVRTRDGDVLSEERWLAHGDRSDPLTEGELQDKFDALAAPVLEPQSVDALGRILTDLDDQRIGGLLAILDTVSPRSSAEQSV